MSYKLKRQFAGKFVVLTGDEEQVFGPDSKAACQTWIAERQGVPQVAAPSPMRDDGLDEATARRKEREWAKKVDAAMRKPLDEEEAELRALLEKRRKPDEVDYLMRTLRPILLAGIDGARRERGRVIHMINRPAA
jgi:hypothetical protein